MRTLKREILFYFVWVSVCALEHMHVHICAHAIGCLWRSEDNSVELVLFSLYLGPRALTQVSGLATLKRGTLSMFFSVFTEASLVHNGMVTSSLPWTSDKQL